MNKEEIIKLSDGGRLIIEQLLPQSKPAFEDKRRKFKIRQEKTASASVFNKQGVYYVTDFGGDGKPKNALDLLMELLNLSFPEALKEAAGMLGLSQSAITQPKERAPSADYQKLQPEAKDEIGDFSYEAQEWGAQALRYIGPYAKATVCEQYGLINIRNYHIISRDKKTGEPVKHSFSATPDYPIFYLKGADPSGEVWGKVIQPKAEKQYRFFYQGKKPKYYLNGLKELRDTYDQQKDESDDFKLPKAIICSGDRDAINVSSALETPTLWLNSETGQFRSEWLQEIEQYVERLYFIPDLDATGQEVAHKLNMQFFDWHQVELPQWLQQQRDSRGYRRKDVTDFLELKTPEDLQRLVDRAKPYRFWDWLPKSKKYQINSTRMFRFLDKCGFYQMRVENSLNEYQLIRVVDKVLKRVSVLEIKDFVNSLLAQKGFPESVRNLFYTSQHAPTKTSLSNLPIAEFPIYRAEKDSMCLFFQNITLKITAEKITSIDRKDLQAYIWEGMIIKHDLQLCEKVPFTYTNDPERFEVNIDDNPTLQFLWNASTPFWQQNNITQEEFLEVKQYLMNKLYVLGYLLHTYKDPLKPLIPVVIDLKIPRDDLVNGGTGKSLFMDFLQQLTNTRVMEGRTVNPSYTHVWSGIDSSVHNIVIDDAAKNFPFTKLYTAASGPLSVNPKGKEPYTIPFEKSPKICITTNHPFKLNDGSTKRRILLCPFSDYYHSETDEYEKAHRPEQDFGKAIPFEYDQDEWNQFYSLLIYAIQFKLYVKEPITPPSYATEQRTLMEALGHDFKEWADEFFLLTPENLNQQIPRRQVVASFERALPQLAKMMKASTFKNKLKDWCKLHGFQLNPSELANKDGRIIKKMNGETVEMFFIQAKEHLKTDEDNDELPF